jgi:hypothetical protein
MIGMASEIARGDCTKVPLARKKPAATRQKKSPDL